jgi:hypothetical protein
MYLAAVKEREEARGDEIAQAPLHSARWEHFPYSCLSHHGDACCDVAREWLLSMDYAQLNGGDLSTGPRWLRQKYEWGPSSWPMHWCDVVNRKVIDCGAHSALAHEAFLARGKTAFRAQFIQRYSADSVAQWRKKWGDEQVSDHWLSDDVIYHEGNALLVGEDEVKLWDSSAGWWINPRQAGGYGSLLAVRVFAEGQWGGGDGFRWGEHRIKPNEWHQVQR